MRCVRTLDLIAGLPFRAYPPGIAAGVSDLGVSNSWRQGMVRGTARGGLRMSKQSRMHIMRRSSWRAAGAAAAAMLMTATGLGGATEGALAPTTVSSVPVSYTPWLLTSPLD